MSHKIEIAPTGRASCKGCKKHIASGDLRFCEAFANLYSEQGGDKFRYWHLRCAATKAANELGPVLAAYDGALEEREALETLVAEHIRPEMPYADHAPTGRARCRACDENIAKGELRVAFERTFDGPMGLQKAAAYSHARCVARYLEREVEQGREAIDPAELMRSVEAHSKVPAEDLAAVRAGLGLAS